MMLQHHQNHHHHSFSFDQHDSSAVPAGYGPTAYNMAFGVNSDSSALDATTTIDNGGVPLTLQPFHNISAITTPKSSGTAVGMAASLGNPFTISQWRELQRQVMIYKYLVASFPVPSELLSLDGSFKQKLSSRNRSKNDPEAGRCRRTDGKKWRCSRDVAHDSDKYCEKHMHRGRPARSRKHVELHTNDNIHNQIKKAHCDSNPFSVSNVGGSSSHFHPYSAFYPYHQSFLSLDNNSIGIKAPSYDFSNWQQRCLEWMMLNGAYNSRWHTLMHYNKLGLTNESFYQNNTESQYLNSFPIYTTSELPPQEKLFSLMYNPLTVPMQTLQYDGSSNAETVENNVNTNNNVSDTSIGNLYDSSLDLSMGGPLAEVLRPIKVTSINDATNSNPSSHVATNHIESIGASGGTGMLSSPSAVLHDKTLVTFSDSSGNSSPTTCIIKGQF
ncbi:hypothetical protein TSUD_414110 [Trifolium subterraneum]|uniref:Growth-regulating factor n=1 Tax=Trifolium subterraneum TaxID=3900 RepID=A0A2Z6P550_TRISU|nr:hypothetical protein TSUD_414110 [Trifolium subterraneum]